MLSDECVLGAAISLKRQISLLSVSMQSGLTSHQLKQGFLIIFSEQRNVNGIYLLNATFRII